MKLRVLVMAVVLAACAGRASYFVRTGDAAYKQGDYAQALRNYESEQRYRPSKEIDDKIAATKIKMVEQELAPIETAFAEGRFDEGVTALVQLDAEKRQQPPVQAFVAKQEKRLRDELAARAGRKEWGRAFVLASRAKKMFPSIAGTVADYGRGWADVLRPAIAGADAKKNVGAVVVLRAALAAATGDPGELASAKQALAAVRMTHALALEVRGKGDLARIQAALAGDDRFALGSGNASRGRVTITLGAPTDAKTMSRGRESARVQKGTRTVENPDRAGLQSELDYKEDILANWKRQKADEYNSPSRTKESIEGYDYPISVAQQDVDEARENLRDAPATIEVPNVVDVEFEVETHTLTVARDVTVDVDAPWKGGLAAQRENVKLARSDKAHAAHREAGVGRDPVELPGAAALGPDLDRAVVTWLGRALTQVAGQYYRSILTGTPEEQSVPLVVALYPHGARDGERKALETSLGVPMADSLIDALATGTLALAFDEPDAPTKTATKSLGTPAPGNKPTTANTPVAGKPGKPTPAIATSPANTPATGTSTPAIATTPPMKPEPAAPADPMLAKAGYALAIAPFTYRRDNNVVLEVSSDGTLKAGATTVAVLRANGTVEDPRGKIVLAIAKNGDVWMPRQTAPSGKLTTSSLAFDRGAAVTIDPAGRVKITMGSSAKVSQAVLAPNNAKVRPAALIVAWLGLGKLGVK
jgi:hypothetical protein